MTHVLFEFVLINRTIFFSSLHYIKVQGIFIDIASLLLVCFPLNSPFIEEPTQICRRN